MSNTLKTTSGPWVAGDSQPHGTRVTGPHAVDIAWVSCASTHGEKGYYTIGQDEAQANAHLIAASPDLFAALEKIVEALVYEDEEGLVLYSESVIAARAALAKARGAS